MNGCVFCGRSPTTRTHAIRKAWLKQLLPGTEMFYHRHTRTGEGEELDNEWLDRKLTAFDPHCACQPCNGGWMHDIDEAGEPIVEPMTFGRAVTLSDAERLTLMTWLTQVAIILDQVQAHPILRPESHKAFADSPGPLVNSAAWLARTETPRPMANGWPISWEMKDSKGVANGVLLHHPHQRLRRADVHSTRADPNRRLHPRRGLHHTLVAL